MGLWLADSLHGCAHCKAENLQAARGCPDLGGRPDLIYELDGQVFNHCLVRLVTPQSLAWLNDYNFFESGFLPEAGGINDQWELDLQAFQLIGSEKAALEKQKRGQ